MCRLRNPKATALHCKISAALFHGGANHETLARLNRLGITQQVNLLLWRAELFYRSLCQSTLVRWGKLKAFCKQPSIKFFDRHMSIKFDYPGGFQNPGVCLQAVPSFPSLTPSFVFWLSPHFSRGKNTEGVSLLPNPTETLATQAIYNITWKHLLLGK